MSKKPLTRAELKRLEQLQKQLEIKESKLNTQEAKLKKQKKELASDQRKLATDKKQFANERKQFRNDKEASNKNSARSLSKPKGDRPFSAQKSRKLKEDYANLKKKHEHFAKLMRDYKKKADQLDAENKVLRRRVENANSKKLPTNDKQLRSMMKENRWLKKKLRELMKELAKQKRWYAKVVKIFKDNNNKWIQKKIEAYKDKEYIIKYVFLDDIKRIVLTRPGHDRNVFKPRVRVKTDRGGQVVLRNVGIDVFDQKVRKRDRQGKRDRRGGSGAKGRNSKDVITKQRPGKDGKNIIKTKYVDHGDKEAITKEKAAKRGSKSNSKTATPITDNGGNGGKKGRKSSGSTAGTDAATAEFLITDPADVPGGADGADAGAAGAAGAAGGSGSEGDDSNPEAKEYNEDDWETLDDPEEQLDEYMIEFLRELGIPVTKESIGNFEDKLPGADDDDDAAEDARLDKEFADALKSDKDLMFEGGDAGSQEMQAQIMYLIGEIDSRNDDLKQLKDIVNGVQYVSNADGGNEEEMKEKELKTPKDKLDAMELVFTNMEQRQEAFLGSLEQLNCDTDALRDINSAWCDEYKTLSKMALTGGGGDNVRKHLDRLRYFIDYFMRELVGRMYDLRCVNAAYYNQGMDSVDKVVAQAQDVEESKDEDEGGAEENRLVFETLQSGIDSRHSNIQEIVSNDEVMNKDNGDDKVAADIENVLNDFLGNMDDWKSLIEETKQKHVTWIETRGNLFNSMAARHKEIGELMDQINNVPSYSMNLQKYLPKEEEPNDNIMDDDNDADADEADNGQNAENVDEPDAQDDDA